MIWYHNFHKLIYIIILLIILQKTNEIFIFQNKNVNILHLIFLSIRQFSAAKVVPRSGIEFKEADLNRRPVREKGVCSDSNQTAQRLQIAQKLGIVLCHASESISTKVCSQIGRKIKCNVWKPCRDEHWLGVDELRFSIERFFEQSATQNNHLPCYWPNINNSSRRSVLNFKFSLFTFWGRSSSMAVISPDFFLKLSGFFPAQSRGST